MSSQQNRTKGNVRPSSSSQAASLLHSSGADPSVGFVGFGTYKSPVFVAAGACLDDEGSNLDPTFRMTLRKLSKKDPITKIKTLNEFSVLCREQKEEMVKTVLPYWPRIYNRLTMDDDHKVREATQTAMSALAARVGRNLAPHLKSIMGHWLMSQCDTYPTVATAAQTAFSTAFTASKQQGVLVFCQDDIEMLLSDNILNQSPLTLTESRPGSSEEIQARYCRLLVMSLVAWRRLLSTTKLSTPRIGEVLESGKLAKIVKIDNSNVRAAVFSFISSVCQHDLVTTTTASKNTVPVVLNSVDESDPVICPCLWEAILSIVRHITDWHQHVNIPKSFLPKLKSLLRNGCHGNAAIVAPNLFPLVGYVAIEIEGGQLRFQQEVLESLQIGLTQTSLTQTDTSSLVSAYMECIQYLLHIHRSNVPVCQALLHDQLLAVVRTSLLDKPVSLSKSPLYPLLMSLLSNSQSDDSLQEEFGRFSDSLKGILLDAINKLCDDEYSYLSARIVKFVENVVFPEKNRQFKQENVKFSLDDEIDPMQLTNEKLTFSMSRQTESILSDLYENVFQKAQSNLSHKNAHLILFRDLINVFYKESLIGAILSSNVTQTSQNQCELFITKVCLPWIFECDDRSETPDATNCLLDITLCVLLKCEAVSTFDILNQIAEKSKSIDKLINKSLAWTSRNPVIVEWLRGDIISDYLVKLSALACRLLLTNNETSHIKWATVMDCLSATYKGEALLPSKTVNKILNEIQKCVEELKFSQSEERTELAVLFVTSVVNKLLTAIQGSVVSSGAKTLLTTLFTISLDDSISISDKTREAVRDTWVTGLTVMSHDIANLRTEDSFIHSCVPLLRDSAMTVQSQRRYDAVSYITKTFMETLAQCLPSDKRDRTISKIVEDLWCPLADCEPHSEVIDMICLNTSLISHWSKEDIDDTKQETTFVQLLYMVLHDLSILKKGDEIREHPEKDNISKKSENPINMENSAILQICPTANGDQISDCYKNSKVEVDVESIKSEKVDNTEKIVDLMFGFSVLNSWTEVDRKLGAQFGDGIERLRDELYRICGGVINSVVREVLCRSLKQGMLWSVCLKQSLKIYVSNDSSSASENLPSDCQEMLINASDDISAAKIHSLQIGACYLDTANQNSLSRMITDQLCRITSAELNTEIGQNKFSGFLSILSSFQNTSFDSILQYFIQSRSSSEDFWSFNTSLNDVSPSLVQAYSQIVTYLTRIVSQISDKQVLNDVHWDFILCIMVAWLQSIEESRDHITTSTAIIQLFTSCCRLLSQIHEAIQGRLVSNRDNFPSNLYTEWTDFFSQAAFDIVIPLFFRVAETPNQSLHVTHLLLSLTNTVTPSSKSHLLSAPVQPYLTPEITTALPDNLQTLFNRLCPLMLAVDSCVQSAAYTLLQRIVEDLPKYDAQDYRNSSDKDTVTDSRSPPHQIISLLKQTSHKLTTILADAHVDDEPQIAHFSHESNVVIGHLYMWRLLMSYINASCSELRGLYAAYLRGEGLVNHLYHIIQLIPDTSTTLNMNTVAMFNEMEASLLCKGIHNTNDLSRLAAYTYKHTVQVCPALVRQWWTDLDRTTASYVDRFTTRYVSPSLCKSQLDFINSNTESLDNMTVKARTTTREVIASYEVEGVTMEMVIMLPSNYPLGQIQVTSEKRVGVKVGQWQKWILQLSIYLQYQNGSIIDGLKVWKRNIDKRFDGVEDCMICFSVVHTTTCELPRLECRTCKKKFHSACLYKWFSTSHNPTCPLCRNLF